MITALGRPFKFNNLFDEQSGKRNYKEPVMDNFHDFMSVNMIQT